MGPWRLSQSIKRWNLAGTGKQPLIYQSIHLTLNYLKRITKISSSQSLVAAALREQKKLNLPWYKNIEPLLKLDEIYFLDHVTAHRILNSKKAGDTTHKPPKKQNNINGTLIDMIEYDHIKPQPSKKFRVNEVIKSLTKTLRKFGNIKSLCPQNWHFTTPSKPLSIESLT